MKKVGEHVTIDFLGVKQEYSPDFYSRIIYKIAKKTRVEVLNITEHKFKPQGFTCLALLAESHMSFHTFPEKEIVSFDFFTCAKISPTAALDILKKEIMQIKTRVQEESPSFFKKLRNIGLVLASIGGVILTAPVSLPAIVTTIGGYVAVAGGTLSAVSQLTTTKEKAVTDE